VHIVGTTDAGETDDVRGPLAVQPRQCGRCRGHFDGDPDADPSALPMWWLCPACRAFLL
jgi:hypothetical protein